MQPDKGKRWNAAARRHANPRDATAGSPPLSAQQPAEQPISELDAAILEAARPELEAAAHQQRAATLAAAAQQLALAARPAAFPQAVPIVITIFSPSVAVAAQQQEWPGPQTSAF